MSSAIGHLIQQARMGRRPKWSQQFLADELCRVGYETTREQIARVERSEPWRVNPELLAAAATVLEIDQQALENAILSDYLAVASALSVRLPRAASGAREDVPTRVSQMIPRHAF